MEEVAVVVAVEISSMFESIVNAIILIVFVCFITGWEPWKRKVEVEGLEELQEAVEGLTDAINLHTQQPITDYSTEYPREVHLPPISVAAHDVLVERERQIAEEGYDAEHDDACEWQLPEAAACYALSARPGFKVGDFWPWDWKFWKPKNRRRDLVKAGALIIAEIDRLDRAAAREANNG